MASRTPWIRHVFAGGWATDFGQIIDAQVPNTLVMPIPFLLTAENHLYELHGGPRKAPGTSKLNSSQMESGAAIRGMYDAWFSGTSGAPSQRRICDVGTKIKADNADGTFSDIATGRTATGVSCYAMLDDFVVIANTADALSKWDGTTFSAVSGGSPTNIKCICEHKGFLFGGGASAAPSALRYTDQFTPNTWSGTIQVGPDDGDGIMAVASHKGELLVFKGPYKGSIWRLTGSSNSDFALVPFVKGIGCAGANLVAPFGDDLIFVWVDGQAYTLSATANYGDYQEVALTRPIATFLRDNVVASQLHKASLVVDSGLGVVWINLPTQGSATPNTLLAMDYRFSPPRWSYLPAYSSYCYSLMEMIDSANSNRRIVSIGGADGYIRKFNQSTRTIDGTVAIPERAKTPFFSYGSPWSMKTIEQVSLASANRGGAGKSITFSWTRSAGASGGGSTQSVSVAERGGGFILGDGITPGLGDELSDGVILGAGVGYGENFMSLETGGEFRAIQYGIEQVTLSQDCEIYALSVRVKPGADSYDNQE